MNISKIALLGCLIGFSVSCGKKDEKGTTSDSEAQAALAENGFGVFWAMPAKAARHVVPLYVMEGNTRKVICTASLIKKGLGVAAKHCIDQAQGREILIGAVYTGNAGVDAFMRGIGEAWKRNPYFPITDIKQYKNYDVVKFKFSTLSEFDTLLGMGATFVPPDPNHEAMISGFGARTNNQQGLDETVRSWARVKIERQDMERGGVLLLSGLNEGAGSCRGDSGGLAFLKDKDGIVSEDKAIGIVLGGVYNSAGRKECSSGITRILPLHGINCWLWGDNAPESCGSIAPNANASAPKPDDEDHGTTPENSIDLWSKYRKKFADNGFAVGGLDAVQLATGSVNDSCTMSYVSYNGKNLGLMAKHCSGSRVKWSDGTENDFSPTGKFVTTQENIAALRFSADVATFVLKGQVSVRPIRLSAVSEIPQGTRLGVFRLLRDAIYYSSDSKCTSLGKGNLAIAHSCDTQPGFSGALLVEHSASATPYAVHAYDSGTGPGKNGAIVLTRSVLDELFE